MKKILKVVLFALGPALLVLLVGTLTAFAAGRVTGRPVTDPLTLTTANITTANITTVNATTIASGERTNYVTFGDETSQGVNTAYNTAEFTVKNQTFTPIECRVTVVNNGAGAGTCTYKLYNVTDNVALCTVSLVCSASTLTKANCTASGSAVAGKVIAMRGESPSVTDTSAGVHMTCSY